MNDVQTRFSHCHHARTTVASTAAALCALLLSACDPIYGIATNVTLHKEADIACIDSTLKDMSVEIGYVEHRHMMSSKFEVLPHWGQVTTSTDYWLYRNGAILQIDQDNEGSHYRNGLERIGARIPDNEIDAYAPIMAQVNARIEARCEVPLKTDGRVRRF